VYTGADACAIQPLLLNEFGQTLYLTGYNLSIFGFYEYYAQIAYRMLISFFLFLICWKFILLYSFSLFSRANVVAAWATRIDSCLVVPIYSTRKPKVFTQNIFASTGTRLSPRSLLGFLLLIVICFLTGG
jgi:hypothetical protein